MDYYPWNQYQQRGQVNNLVRVTGIEGAKAYQLPPNSSVALFDGNDDLFYVKTTDGGGFPTIRVFQFSEIQQQVQQESQFVTRQELDEVAARITGELSQKIDALLEVGNGKQPVQQRIPSV